MPCLHLYAVPTSEQTLPGIENLRDYLKGRDRLVAVALERAGLVPRVVPYVFESPGSPWLSFRREGRAIDVDEIIKSGE